MRKIKLNKGKSAIVDDEDFAVLSKYTWFVSDTGYAKSSLWIDNEAKHVRMHHLIIGKPKKGEYMDHINHNKLDNRRINLRICTNAENMRNRTAPSNNTSGFKGVWWHSARKKWAARVICNYKSHNLGLYSDKKDAAKAYNEAAKRLFGEFAHLNIV